MTRRRFARWAAVAVAAGLAAFGCVALGRATADHDTARAYADGQTAGVLEGQAEGVRTGRALQASLAVPPGDRDATRAAFDAGYVAGANDAFGGFDGGWAPGVPYVVVVAPGSGGIAYRFVSRTPLAAQTTSPSPGILGLPR